MVYWLEVRGFVCRAANRPDAQTSAQITVLKAGLLQRMSTEEAMFRLQLYDKWLLRAKPHAISADLQSFGLSATGRAS